VPKIKNGSTSKSAKAKAASGMPKSTHGNPPRVTTLHLLPRRHQHEARALDLQMTGSSVKMTSLFKQTEWSWAVSKVNDAVNETLDRIEKDDTLKPEEKRKRRDDVEKAWQRILQG
jgi:hypothetical protein